MIVECRHWLVTYVINDVGSEEGKKARPYLVRICNRDFHNRHGDQTHELYEGWRLKVCLFSVYVLKSQFKNK